MIKEFRDSRGGFGGGRDRGRSGGFGGGRGGFGGGRSFGGGRDRDGPREMFNATCSTCGKECQVPFKPTGSKPVLCSDCFGKSDSRNFNSRNSPQSEGSSVAISQINAKLDKILQVLQDLELVADEQDDDLEDEDEFEEDSLDEDLKEPSMEITVTEDEENTI